MPLMQSGPLQLPEQTTDALRYLNTLVEQLQFALEELDRSFYTVSYVVPDRPREGMIRLADGTTWNPGLGKGLYQYTGGVWRKLSGYENVLDYGAVGDGSHDDTTAIVAALTAAASNPSSRMVLFPTPQTSAGYLVTSTITIPCDNIVLRGVGRKTKIVSNVSAGPLFDTNGKSYVTFDDLFLAGQVNGADQVGIYVNGVSVGSIGVRILNSFIGQFGVKPPGTISGSCVKVRGDNQELVIADNTFEVWGDGVDIDATVDLLRIHDNYFGVSTGNDSGWGLKLKNSVGSGQNLIEHNNFVTPGGGVKIGPTAGLIHFRNNQYEALTSNPDVSNDTGSGNSTAFWFDSALCYVIRDNNIELHAKCDYGYFCTNFSNDPIIENNKCGGAVLAQWVFPSTAAILGFRNNTDFSGVPNYNNPYYPGIEHTNHQNGYRGIGTQYPAAPMHLHLRDAPIWLETTLNGGITDVATSLTLTSASEIAVNSILYIDAEQLVVTDIASAPTLSVVRAHNGTTAASHSNGAVVTVGPVGMLMLTSTRIGQSAHTMAFGFDTGMGYLKVRTRVGNVFYALPLRTDKLVVHNSDPSANTTVVIKGVVGQADYPLKYIDSNDVRKASISLSGGLFATLPTYANNAAAKAGGLVAGDFYIASGDPARVAIVVDSLTASTWENL